MPSASHAPSQGADDPSNHRRERHDHRRLCSQSNLEHARRSRDDYDTQAVRNSLTRAFRCAFGFAPYEWQLDVAEALSLRLDTILIAGTGAGKTNPFVLLPLVNPGKKVIIISPLKLLQYDQQQQRFLQAGVRAEAVNGDTWGPRMRQVRDKDLHPVCAVVIDEAHCMEQWAQFRYHYNHLGKLRSLYPHNVPFLATSATLPPTTLDKVCTDLQIELSDAFFVNLGNDRPNITTHVHEVRSGHDYEALKALLPLSASGPDEMNKTIIFVNDVTGSQRVCREVRKLLPAHLRKYVGYVHARRASGAKHRIMRRFRKNKIKILVATEAAGMGTDISDVKVIIQLGVPSSLSVWYQHAGRGGRSASVHADAHLLYEKSVFERKKKKRNKGRCGLLLGVPEDTDTPEETVAEAAREANGSDSLAGDMGDGKDWAKVIDPALRMYLETRRCRRDVADEYFDNPPERQEPSGPCCDNCEYAHALPPLPTGATPTSTPENDAEGEESELASQSSSASSSCSSTPSESANINGKRPMTKGPRRRGDKRRPFLCALSQWRETMKHSERFAASNISCEDILPDRTLRQLATWKRIKTVDDIAGLSPRWLFARRYGQDILDLLNSTEQRVASEARRAKASKQIGRTAARQTTKKARVAPQKVQTDLHASALPYVRGPLTRSRPSPTNSMPIPVSPLRPSSSSSPTYLIPRLFTQPDGRLFYMYVPTPYSPYNIPPRPPLTSSTFTRAPPLPGGRMPSPSLRN
ncbi:P-loop containing nucleoside triphosphate hydrolase protein [Schizophyllum commune]